MCFQMSGLKSKTKFLRNESTLQRHHTGAGLYKTECSARHKNVPGTVSQCCRNHVRSTKSAGEMSICCSATGEMRTTGAACKNVSETKGDVLSLPSYLAEIWRSSSSRSCTAVVPETLQTGGWQPPLEGAQTSSGHFKGEIKLFQSKGSDKNSEASIEIIAVVIWQPWRCTLV